MIDRAKEAPGVCPKCGSVPGVRNPELPGAKPDTKRSKMPFSDRDTRYLGTAWCSVSEQWSCMECGCQFTDEGPAPVEVLKSFDGETWSKSGKTLTTNGKRPVHFKVEN